MKNVMIFLVLVAILLSVSTTEALVNKHRRKSLKERAYDYCSCREGVKRWEYTPGIDKFILVCNNGDYVLGHSNVEKVVFRDCRYIQK